MQNSPQISKQILSPQEWEKQEALLRAGHSVSHPGLVGQAWTDALRAILYAPVEMLLVAGAMGSFAVARYYLITNPSAVESTWVSAVSDADGSIHISFPHTFGDIVGLLDGVLDFGGISAEIESSLALDFAELSVLFALVDLFKARELQSLLQRQITRGSGFSLEEIQQVLQRGLASQDYRWWVTTGQLLTFFPLVTEAQHLQSALERLVQRQLVKRQGHLFMPHLCGDFVGSLLMPLSAASVTFMGRSPEGVVKSLDTVLGIRTATAFWTINFAEGQQYPRVEAIATPGLMLLTYLHELQQLYCASAMPHISNPSTPTQEVSSHNSSICQQCHAPLAAGNHFCPHCGAVIPSTKPTTSDTATHPCPQCGHVSHPGAKFCSHCGLALN